MSGIGSQFRADLNALIDGMKDSGLSSEEAEARVALMMMAVEMVGMIPGHLEDTLPCKGQDESHDHSDVWESVVLGFGLWVRMAVHQGKITDEKVQSLLRLTDKIEISMIGFKQTKTASA